MLYRIRIPSSYRIQLMGVRSGTATSDERYLDEDINNHIKEFLNTFEHWWVSNLRTHEDDENWSYNIVTEEDREVSILPEGYYENCVEFISLLNNFFDKAYPTISIMNGDTDEGVEIDFNVDRDDFHYLNR